MKEYDGATELTCNSEFIKQIFVKLLNLFLISIYNYL